MKKIQNLSSLILFLISVIILSSFTGCSQKTPDVIKETKYIEKECPKPLKKPEFTEYQVVILEINGEVFYAIPKNQVGILVSNWISYKEYSEGNTKLLESALGDSSK